MFSMSREKTSIAFQSSKVKTWNTRLQLETMWLLSDENSGFGKGSSSAEVVDPSSAPFLSAPRRPSESCRRGARSRPSALGASRSPGESRDSRCRSGRAW